MLKGDIQSAVEIHELLYQVFQKYGFIPEAFTHKFDVHWGQNPLRPEFAESTYLLYKATHDPYYLQVLFQEYLLKQVLICFRSASISSIR